MTFPRPGVARVGAVATIEDVGAREILDSRGNPTVEVEVLLDDGTTARAAVPSGASTGAFEAVERRDGDKGRYGGKGVQEAVSAVLEQIGPALVGYEASEQRLVDQAMHRPRRHRQQGLGSAPTPILGVSLAVAKAAADSAGLPLFRYLGGPNAHVLPVPMLNILNGGAHADGGVDIQEFMIAPIGAATFREALRWGAETYHALKSVLKGQGLATGLGDEGGFAPGLPSQPRRARPHRRPRSSKAGFTLGTDIALALDVAATEFYTEGGYPFEGSARGSRRDDRVLRGAGRRLPAGLDRGPARRGRLGRLDGVHRRSSATGAARRRRPLRHQPQRLQRGIDTGAANALLVKVNQIGTLTETLDAVDLAHRSGYRTMMSHRSGETEDTTIADLAVAVGSGQIKTGAPARSRARRQVQPAAADRGGARRRRGLRRGVGVPAHGAADQAPRRSRACRRPPGPRSWHGRAEGRHAGTDRTDRTTAAEGGRRWRRDGPCRRAGRATPRDTPDRRTPRRPSGTPGAARPPARSTAAPPAAPALRGPRARGCRGAARPAAARTADCRWCAR